MGLAHGRTRHPGRLVEQAHAAWLWDQAWQLAETLPVMFDWRADWRSWERTHQLALDAARAGGDADAQARILRSLGALYRELGRYDEAAALLTQAAEIFAEPRRPAAAGGRPAEPGRHLPLPGPALRRHRACSPARSRFSVEEGDIRSVAGALNGMADAYRGLSRWDESGRTFRDCIAIYQDIGDQLEEARAKVRYALVFRDQHLIEQALPLIEEGLRVRPGARRPAVGSPRHAAAGHRAP